MTNYSKINVVVLLGGTSPEREVSKDSGKSIYEALVRLGFNVKIIDPGYGLNQPENIEEYFTKTDYAEISNRNVIDVINSAMFDKVDLVFLALHGKWGEDGVIQSLLELRGLKYTGSNVLASALAMDKIKSKMMFLHYHVTTPNWFVVKSEDYLLTKVILKINKLFGFPCVIKSNDSGSSIGMTICFEENEVENALEKAKKYSETIIVEEYIEGKELTVGILGKQVFPVLEIKPKSGLYDFASKYTDGLCDFIVPAEIPPEISKHLQNQALLAYNSVGCSVYGRVDFRLSNDNKSYCLEVNNLPGMTSHSLVPKMATSAGISFDSLVEKIVKLSL